MRVLLNGLIASHLSPMLPLAWALRAAGCDLLVVGGTDVATAAGAAGLNAVALAGATRSPERVAKPTGPRKPAARAPGAVPSGRPPWDAILRDKEPALRANLDRFTDVLTAWGADLVLTDPFGYGAQVAAAVAGVPAVVHELGAWASNVAMDEAARRVFGPLCRDRGAEAGLPAPALVIDPTPGLLRDPDAGAALGVRHVPFSGSDRIPDWALRPADGERICVVLGVWGTELLAGSGRLGKVVGDIAGSAGGREVLVLLDEQHHRAVGAMPQTVRLHAPLPLDLVLPGCAAVVHHGGSGSTLTSAAHGIPQVVLPPQQPQLAAAGRRVQASGVGRTLAETDGRLDKAVAAALDEVIHQPSYRTAARTAADQIAGMPAPAALVPRLAALIAG